MGDDSDARDKALALLRDQHAFPGPFAFRVVIRPGHRTRVLTAMVAATGDTEALIEVDERASRNGTYLALHVRLQLESAEGVLDVYEVLKQVDGILTVL